MTSRRETLHFEDLYLSRETLSDCHVSQKTAVLTMMNGFVLVREILIEDYQRPALIWLQGCPWWWHQKEKLHSYHRLVSKLCFTVMLVRKLLCWWWWIVPWMREREMKFASLKMFRELLWCDIKIRSDTLDPCLQGCYWWCNLQEEKLCTSKISSLVEEQCPTVMLVRKLLCWWWWIVSLWWERYS